MNFKEIERRFLIKNYELSKSEDYFLIKQAYLKIEKNYVLRIRSLSNQFYITLS